MPPARIYKEIDRMINESSFEVRVPDDYETKIPGYYKKYPNRRPMYYGETPDCYSRLPIARIIELCVNNIEFTIINRDDVPLICSFIDQYVTQASLYADQQEPTSELNVFLANCRNALGVLRHSNERVAKEVSQESKLTQTEDMFTLLRKFNL
jgi:hypothetical protein